MSLLELTKLSIIFKNIWLRIAQWSFHFSSDCWKDDYKEVYFSKESTNITSYSRWNEKGKRRNYRRSLHGIISTLTGQYGYKPNS